MPQTSHHSSQPRRRPTERISQHVLYGLLGYVVVLFLAFFLFGYDTPYWKNDRMNAPMLTDVLLGAVYGIVGSISYYKSHLPAGTKVVMTGGWADQLSRLCDFDVTVSPHLVSIGLNRILIYNENK